MRRPTLHGKLLNGPRGTLPVSATVFSVLDRNVQTRVGGHVQAANEDADDQLARLRHGQQMAFDGDTAGVFAL